MDKQLVVVSRKWHEPFIRVDVTQVGVGVTMTLEDFVRALATESGTDMGALLHAGDKVVSAMKQETSRVM